MATSIYITSVEGFSGKSTVALGILDALRARVDRVGVFRPISHSHTERDYVLDLLLDHDDVNLTYEQCTGVTYDDVHSDADNALAIIVEKYRAVERQCNAVVIVGSDFTDVGNPTESGFNARIAANIGAPVVVVVTGRDPKGATGSKAAMPPRPASDIIRVVESSLSEIRSQHANPIAVIANRSDPDLHADVVEKILALDSNLYAASIAEDPFLVAPTVRTVMAAIEGTFLRGADELLDREALGVMVGAMSVENIVARLREGFAILIPGDRTDAILAVLTAHHSENFPSLAAVILYGGFPLSEQVQLLMSGIDHQLPIISTSYDTYEAVLHVVAARGRFAADSQRKYDTALQLFRESVDAEQLLSRMNVTATTVVTPLMFEYALMERAGSQKKHIVLPEGDDDRIVRATATLLARDVADITLLGDELKIRARASELGLDISSARVISPRDPQLVERFAQEYSVVRAHKGISIEDARDVVSDVSCFGTLMVHLGLADGMVSGATHTTAHTIKPGFEIIKTAPGVSVVSSVFLMCLADRVLVYGDCAVVPDPSSKELADIAISAAATARRFGIEPKVAMLSYSTGESGQGVDVDKVREATRLVRERRPDFPVEGPLQYDAASEPSVALLKMPNSEVAGVATVFIFPDLNTGNTTYKAVQRSAGAVAIGPVLQGLAKPVNDLSRGATVRDIINTVAITAIQAQDA